MLGRNTEGQFGNGNRTSLDTPSDPIYLEEKFIKAATKFQSVFRDINNEIL